jgi:molybdate transport system substrate-binding protein
MKAPNNILTKAIICAAAVFALSAAAKPAQVDVLASLAIKPVIEAISPSFERASGHNLVVRFELTPAVKRQIEAGAAFDVAIANPPHIVDLIKQGKIVAESKADVARFGVGVGVRAGAQKPNVTSSDAFKRALLSAKAVAYVGEGTSGAFVRGLLDRLAITEAMKGKLQPAGVAASLSSVASGDAEIVVMPVPLILSHTGVELAGALPAELQDLIVMTAGVSASAKDTRAARAFVEFLLTTEASAVIKAKGYERPTE